jgi:mono/diheme cytochrome c family protein
MLRGWMKTRRSTLRAIAGMVFTTTVLLAACAIRPTLSPIEPPPKSAFDAALVSRGAQLAILGNCSDCHTAPGGRPYAGGRALRTPFGTLYSANITPDAETGIGRWSEHAFSRALREGLDRDGRHLYPVMPYDHFTKLRDDDIKALYAFIMTREPVRAMRPAHLLPFPLNNRGLLGIWKSLYFEAGVFQSDRARSAEWNRGAYLVDGLGHCGACHTPRNLLGAEKKRLYLAGGEAEGWHAPALNAESPSPVAWTAGTLYQYLRTGLADAHAIAAGPMDPVVRNLARAPEQDVRAITTYLLTLMERESVVRSKPERAPVASDRGGTVRGLERGAALYAGNCAQCHDAGRTASSGSGLDLALGTAMTIPTSANLIRITLEGIAAPDGEAGRFMPGFASALTDDQMRDLVAYIRVYFGRQPPWRDVDTQLKKARASRP